MANFKRRHTGGKRDCLDVRDFERKYGGHEIPSPDEHPEVDLRIYVDQVYNQGELNSCTCNAICAAFSIVLMKQALMKNMLYIDFKPSRLFVYYNSLKYEGKNRDNDYVTVRDTFKAMYKKGICPELLWPYEEEKFGEEPPHDCYISAKDNRLCRFEKVKQNMDQIRACLKAGFPFVFMFELYDSFYSLEDEQSGVMPLPSNEEIESQNCDVHAALCVGYDESTQCITVLNSWGTSFGDRGYFYMSYEYILDKDRTGCLWMIDQVCEKSLDSKPWIMWSVSYFEIILQ